MKNAENRTGRYREKIFAWFRYAFSAGYPLLILVALRVGLFFLVEREGSFFLGDIYRRVVFSILLYFIYNLSLNRFTAIAAALLTEMALVQISNIKVANIGEPLSFIDLTDLQQNVHLIGYATAAIYITVAVFFLLLATGWKYRTRGWGTVARRLPFALLLPAMFVIFIFNNGKPVHILKDGLSSLKIRHRNVFMPIKSVQANGIVGHLLQSAQNITLPEPGPHHFYDRQAQSVLSPTRPDVVVILCESCFTTQDDRFPTPMRFLGEEGFTPFEMLSPAYGGDTAEAEFESLTGLSSAVLAGVDYQQFANRYRSDIPALPRHFADSGYLTVSMHNYEGIFWRRNVMHPKLGFETSVFLDQMKASRWPENNGSNWARDAILYDSALDAYRAAPKDQEVFLYLITVGSHGKYPDVDGDLGKNTYLALMETAMADMRAFLSEIDGLARQRGRPLAIVIFGDHKPALSGVFYQNGVLPHSLYRSHNARRNSFDFVLLPSPEDWKARSAISVYARFPDAADTEKFTEALNDRPLFCLPAELSALVPGQDSRFWRGVTAVCRQPVPTLLKPEGSQWEEEFPPQLYAERLFPMPEGQNSHAN